MVNLSLDQDSGVIFVERTWINMWQIDKYQLSMVEFLSILRGKIKISESLMALGFLNENEGLSEKIEHFTVITYKFSFFNYLVFTHKKGKNLK